MLKTKCGRWLVFFFFLADGRRKLRKLAGRKRMRRTGTRKAAVAGWQQLYSGETRSTELEMWQADSFDPKRIDLELGLGRSNRP